MRRPMMTLLLTAAVAYAALAGAMFLGQARLLYLPDLPSRALVDTPQRIGLVHEDVFIETEDGLRLHGWYLPAPRARGSLLFFHGNAGNISHRLDSLRIFHRLRLDVLIVDYRGYGRSEGRPDEAGLQRDARAAWRYLVELRGEAPARIVLFGRSLGGAVAAVLAAELAGGRAGTGPAGALGAQPAALILESSFISVPELAADLYPWLPARRLARLRHDTLGALADVRCPVLVVHSRDDEIIPWRHGQALHDAARPPKALLELGGDHNQGFLQSGEAYVRGLDAFLGQHLPRGRPDADERGE
jgi:uncharacterized protein